MFTFSETACYLMPAHFGGSEGPPKSQTYHDVTSVMIGFETDADMLRAWLPRGFELLAPEVTIVFAMNRQVEWLAGGGYNLVGVNVPVRYAGGSERLDGAYALVVWENRTCPILGGREQTGIPKIHADITDLRQLDEQVSATASYDGSTFLRVEFKRNGRMDRDRLEALNRELAWLNWFGWRYIPNLGRAGAALSHPTLYPIETVCTDAWNGTGRLEWSTLTWQQDPPQAHVIAALAALPVKDWRPAVMHRGKQVLHTEAARQLA